MLDVVIVGAKRTPIGALGGALSSLKAHGLGALSIAVAMHQAGLDGEEISEVVIGHVLTAAAGMNPARQAARAAGISDSAPAMTVNQVCGSGLRAVALAAQQIKAGDARVVIAGGHESMSNAPHAAVLRNGKKLGDITLVDTTMRDGLSDAFFGYPMGNTAENVANLRAISRVDQDAFALASQQKASAAQRAGRFVEEIVPARVAGRKGDTLVAEDEPIRHDADADSIARQRPALVAGGAVSAANSSGINDGAAALALTSSAEARSRGLTPLARIVSWAHAGVDPSIMGLGPVPASRMALEKAGWALGEIDLWEINEALAAQSIAVVNELGIDPSLVNVNGGAIALGHPIGASGARVLVTLIYEMRRRDAHKGLATLCIGGGMGIALCIQRD